MEPVRVLCTLRFDRALLDELRAISARLEVSQVTCHNDKEVAEAIAESPELAVLYAFYVPQDLLQLAPALHWLQLHSAGIDHILDHPVMSSKVDITTTSGIHATPIAEYVFASILAQRWQVPHWTECQREAEWPSGRWDLYARPELRGSTLGILGYGSIGREVGRLAKAFGMRVLALQRSTVRVDQGYREEGIGDPEGTIPEHYYEPDDRLEMLAECDYVVVSLPLNQSTRGFLGEAELKAMKESAYLVNIARGGVLDETALVRALREGWIAGAGLDVYDQEPLPAESPLWSLDNALLSPHVAGFTPRYDERAAGLFAENLARYLSGRRLLNLVDKKLGY